jgi:hypothetical protein
MLPISVFLALLCVPEILVNAWQPSYVGSLCTRMRAQTLRERAASRAQGSLVTLFAKAKKKSLVNESILAQLDALEALEEVKVRTRDA